MRISIRLASVFFLLLSTFSYSQRSNTVVKAKIVAEEMEGNIKITGTAENLSDVVQSLSYKLTVIKNSNSNNQSNNSQEGVFSLNPSETKNLSVTQVNLKKGEGMIVLLLFYDENNKLVGKDRMVFGDEKKKTK